MWTTRQILSFAPDAGIAQRGQDLATERMWRDLSSNEKAVWGECKSSGASFYLTVIDLNGPAFKCNCPTPKAPCKHAVGLMLLLAKKSDTFQIVEEYPEWVKEWLSKRKEKSIKTKKEDTDLEVEEHKAYLRLQNRKKRLAQMKIGLEDLEVWLMDTIRQGLAATERQGYSFWQDISARMVDAKLGGIGRKIQAMQLLQGGNTNWIDKMLTQMTDLYLVAKGFKHLENLPIPLQHELLSVAGVTTRKEYLFSQEGIKDEWIVNGQIEGVEDNLNFRRIWLMGKNTQQSALILDFSFGDAGFPNHYPTGSILRGELVYYPSAFPLRAALKLPMEIIKGSDSLSGYADFQQFLSDYAVALTANPWLLDFPVCFENVIPALNKKDLFLIDKNKTKLPVMNRQGIEWKLLSMSGGHPIHIFGEWTGDIFVPLSAEANRRLIAF